MSSKNKKSGGRSGDVDDDPATSGDAIEMKTAEEREADKKRREEEEEAERLRRKESMEKRLEEARKAKAEADAKKRGGNP